jgi:serine/threonine protein kinase
MMDVYFDYMAFTNVFFKKFKTCFGSPGRDCVSFEIEKGIQNYSDDWFSYYYMYREFVNRYEKVNVKQPIADHIMLNRTVLRLIHEDALKKVVQKHYTLIYPNCYKFQNKVLKCIRMQTLGPLANEVWINKLANISSISRLDNIEFTYDTCCVTFPDYGKCIDNQSANIWMVLHKTTRAIMHLHHARIAHMDIKHSNILLDQDENVHVCDFGLSFRVQTQDLFCTNRISPTYRPPELFTSHPFLNYNPFAADIWSLGKVFLSMITDDRMYLTLHELNNWYKTISSYKPKDTVTANIYELARQMLNMDPNSRPTASMIFSQMELMGTPLGYQLCDTLEISKEEHKWRSRLDLHTVRKYWNAYEAHAVNLYKETRFVYCLDAIILACEITLRVLFKTKREFNENVYWELALNATRPWCTQLVHKEHLDVMSVLNYEVYLDNFLTKQQQNVNPAEDFVTIKEAYLKFGLL